MLTFKLMRVFAAIALLLSTVSLAADRDCSPVNLYENPVDPLWEIPIAQQGPLYVCYALTAAQMIDYYLLSHGMERPEGGSSALWIAYNHKSSGAFPRKLIQWDRRELGYSYMKWAIADAKRNGICGNSAVDPVVSRIKSDARMTDFEFIYLFEQVWMNQDRIDWNDRKSIESFIAELNQEVEGLARAGILSDLIARIAERIRGIPGKNGKSALPYFGETIFGECRENRLLHPSLPEPNTAGIAYASNARILRRIDSALDGDSRQPAGIGYCANIYDEGHQGYKNFDRLELLSGSWMPRALRTLTSGCYQHYSLIVGRRPASDGTCQYLLRNSYGTGFWSKNWECVCARPDQTLYACAYDPAHSQDDAVVGCWVDSQTLASNTFDVEYFESPNTL
ncbi:MAG: hypothetical protein HYW49_09795 [Deltaproteobacteria bacterium]|nr:hypothetical protein [Deltaproteobacteria bacterium]